MNKIIKNNKKGGFIKNNLVIKTISPSISIKNNQSRKNDGIGVKQNTGFVKPDGLGVKTNNQLRKNDGLGVKLNTGFVKQNTGFVKPNSGFVKPNTGFVKPDGLGVKTNNQVGKNDGLGVKPNSGFVKPDGIGVKTNNQVRKNDGVGVKPNSGFVKPDGIGLKQNTGFVKPDGVGVKPNSGFVKPDGIGLKGDMDGLGKEKGDMSPRFVYLYKNKFEMEAVTNKYDMKGLSPLSGYEPTYNPNYWNNNKNIKNNNNCYSYSVNNKNHHFGKPQPGYFARFNHIQNNQYKCAYFFKRILNDIPSVYLTSFKQKCKKGFTKAFFAIDSNKNEHDYHFYRQDTNKLWSHKPGTTNVINYDADYKIIQNPLNANRNYTSYNYDKPCFFFCVNNKFGKTKAKI